MIERLEELQPGEMLTIDNEFSKQLTSLEDFTIYGTRNFLFEGQQVIILELNEHHLIASDMGGDLKFAICEVYDEDNGKYLDDDKSFLEEIELTGGESSSSYRKTNASSSEEEEDDAFCEYVANDHYDYHYDYLFVLKKIDGMVIYRGATVEEDAILL